MPREGPRCRRCAAPAAGVLTVAELAEGWAERPVAELALCGEHLMGVSEACGFDPPRPGSVREVRRA